MKHLYFVRHGQSEANAAKKWSGHADHVLMPEGHEQAKQTAASAKQQGLKFDIIICSPLQRAVQTAKHIATAVGYPYEKIVLHDGFKERCFGELEDKTNHEVRKAYKLDESVIDTYKDVEKLADIQLRAQQMLEYLHTLPQDTVLVVAHGSFGRALRRAITKDPLHERGKSINNAELIKFI